MSDLLLLFTLLTCLQKNALPSCALKKIDNNENAIHEKSSAMDELC